MSHITDTLTLFKARPAAFNSWQRLNEITYFEREEFVHQRAEDESGGG